MELIFCWLKASKTFLTTKLKMHLFTSKLLKKNFL